MIPRTVQVCGHITCLLKYGGEVKASSDTNEVQRTVQGQK